LKASASDVFDQVDAAQQKMNRERRTFIRTYSTGPLEFRAPACVESSSPALCWGGGAKIPTSAVHRFERDVIKASLQMRRRRRALRSQCAGGASVWPCNNLRKERLSISVEAALRSARLLL
jgi:hypothetical protein